MGDDATLSTKICFAADELLPLLYRVLIKGFALCLVRHAPPTILLQNSKLTVYGNSPGDHVSHTMVHMSPQKKKNRYTFNFRALPLTTG